MSIPLPHIEKRHALIVIREQRFLAALVPSDELVYYQLTIATDI